LRWGCFFILLLVLGVLSIAQPLKASAVTLSLDDVLERGLENNLNLKKNLIDLSIAEYSANRLWSEVFPTISGSLGASYSSNLFSGDKFEVNKGGTGFNASLGVNLTLNAGIPYAMKNVSLAYQVRLLSYEDARNQIEIQLTKNFYSLIADRDSLAVLDDMARLAQLQYEKNQRAFNNGLIGELALMQSRLGLENSRYNLSAAQSAYAVRMGEFLSQLGVALDASAGAELDGKIVIVKIDIDAEKLIRECLPRRPDIVSRRQEIERLENAEKQTARSIRAPSLGLSAQWRSSNFDPFTDSLSGSATFSIPVDPWIAGTAKNQSIRNARSAVDKAKLDLQITEDAAAAQIRSLAANMRNSWASIEIARLSLSIAERSYALAEQGFRSGTVESLKLEDTQNELSSARQQLLQSEFSYLNMVLDISAALNINWKELMQ
jgi:outer membrane protein TolC